MQTALVTGATGFTGGALCERLVRDGWRVSAFTRPSSRMTRLKELGVDCRILDLTDPRQVYEQLPDVDVIFHIAAAYRTEHADRDEFRRVNLEGTRNMLEAARKRGVGRFVHCSTVGVQGHIEDPPADEDYRFAPNDHYQRSKMEGELAAREYFAQGLQGAVVRPAPIYGPGDMRFLKLFRSIHRRVFVMVGSGHVYYHMVYIDDLVEGFLLASRHEKALGEVFTIAGPSFTSLNGLVAEIARAVGRPPPRLRIPVAPVYAAAVACEKICNLIGVAAPLYPRRVEFFQMSRAFSTQKARTALGYEPKVDLAVGLQRTGEWYRSEGLL